MKKLFIIIFVLLGHINLYSFEKLNIGYGQDLDSSDVLKISAIKKLDYVFIKDTKMDFEVSAEYLKGKKDDMFIFSAQPIISYDITDKLYSEFGIGIAYLTKDEIDDRRYGIQFHFKGSLGLGYKFSDSFESKLNITHYSNGNSHNDENEGLDIVMLNLIYSF